MRRSPLRSHSPKLARGSRSSNVPASHTRNGPPGDAMDQVIAQAATKEMTYREAVREALRDALRRDERAFLMGEDVGRYGGGCVGCKGILVGMRPGSSL